MRKIHIFLGLLLFLVLASPGWAQIAFDSTANSGVQTAASYSFNITINAAGANRLLVVGVSIGDSDTTVSSITAAGIALAFIRRDVRALSAATELWRLVAPATGVVSIVVTLSVAPVRSTLAGAVSLTGVDQTTPVDASNGASGIAAAQPSVSLTTVAENAWVVDTVVDRTNEVLTATSPQVERWNVVDDNSVLTFGGSTKGPVTPAGATTMSWSVANSDWVISAASFKPAGGAVPAPAAGNKLNKLEQMDCCDLIVEGLLHEEDLGADSGFAGPRAGGDNQPHILMAEFKALATATAQVWPRLRRLAQIESAALR